MGTHHLYHGDSNPASGRRGNYAGHANYDEVRWRGSPAPEPERA